MGWLFISGVGWNVASMWEVNAHPTDNDLFGKSQSNEADLKRSSLYRRDCKSRWLRSNQTKCWFGRVKGPPSSTQATLVVLTNATSLVLEHSFRGKGLGCLWIQFKLANYVIAQTPERKIQWSNWYVSFSLEGNCNCKIGFNCGSCCMTCIGMLFQYLYGRFFISGATNDGKLNASRLAIPLYFKGTLEGGLCRLV